MLIAICVTLCAVTQAAGLYLIYLGLGRPSLKIPSDVDESAIMDTLDSDYGGLI